MTPLLGVGSLFLAVLAIVFVVLAPGRERTPMSRLRPDVAQGPTLLSRSTSLTTTMIDRIMRARGLRYAVAQVLDKAGLKVRVQDFALLVIGGTLGVAALGLLIFGPWLGLPLAAAVPLGVKAYLALLTKRRQAAFADQIDDSLQLLASSLRAGHSLLQALSSVSQEAEDPTAGEFGRIINETRVGRSLADSLNESADRMASEDFVWVSQAIAINREVGGDLAGVLDGVGHTIRERNQIRRQVIALSAEGKLSAYVLIALPLGIGAFLSLSNPAYMAKFVEGPVGYALIAAATALMLVGTLWMRKVVSFRF
ncbi:MAG: type II secretion system F family protein [Ornithinimicrobium sp.]